MIKKLTTLSIILASSLLMAQEIQTDTKNQILLEKIKQLEITKLHKFVPTEIKDGGSLIFTKGHFDTPRGKRPAMMYFSHDLKTAVYGRGFDTKTAQEYKSYSMEALKASAGIVYGTGETEYILVVDPLCPACWGLEKVLHMYKDEAKIYIMFFPGTSGNPNARKAVAHILAKKTNDAKFDELVKIANGNKDYLNLETISPETDALISVGVTYSKELGTRGTPTLFSGDGREVNRGVLEYMHKKKLEAQKKAQEENK